MSDNPLLDDVSPWVLNPACLCPNCRRCREERFRAMMAELDDGSLTITYRRNP